MPSKFLAKGKQISSPDCHGTGTVQVRRQTPMGVFATSSPCPKCGGDAERIMSNTSFKLEGGGWFASCYGGKASGSASDVAPAADAAPAKADAAPAKAEAAASGSGGGSKAATA